VAWRGGDAPSATVEGGYSFTHTTWDYVYICDGVEEGCTLEPINRYSSPFDEHDVVGVRQTADSTALIGEFGGGIDLLVTSSSGFRTDFRVRVSPAVDRVVLDASPTINRSTSGSYAASFTHPSLAFNSLPSSSFPPVVPGPPSSLSGPVVDDFTTFEAEGTHLQLLISVGYFFRF
jgi:hypothetical protein